MRGTAWLVFVYGANVETGSKIRARFVMTGTKYPVMVVEETARRRRFVAMLQWTKAKAATMATTIQATVANSVKSRGGAHLF